MTETIGYGYLTGRFVYLDAKSDGLPGLKQGKLILKPLNAYRSDVNNGVPRGIIPKEINIDICNGAMQHNINDKIKVAVGDYKIKLETSGWSSDWVNINVEESNSVDNPIDVPELFEENHLNEFRAKITPSLSDLDDGVLIKDGNSFRVVRLHNFVGTKEFSDLLNNVLNINAAFEDFSSAVNPIKLQLDKQYNIGKIKLPLVLPKTNVPKSMYEVLNPDTMESADFTGDVSIEVNTNSVIVYLDTFNLVEPGMFAIKFNNPDFDKAIRDSFTGSPGGEYVYMTVVGTEYLISGQIWDGVEPQNKITRWANLSGNTLVEDLDMILSENQ